MFRVCESFKSTTLPIHSHIDSFMILYIIPFMFLGCILFVSFSDVLGVLFTLSSGLVQTGHLYIVNTKLFRMCTIQYKLNAKPLKCEHIQCYMKIINRRKVPIYVAQSVPQTHGCTTLVLLGANNCEDIYEIYRYV